MKTTKNTPTTATNENTATAPAPKPDPAQTPAWELNRMIQQPRSGKAGALVGAALTNASALGFASVVDTLDRERLAADVGRLLATTDKGNLSGKGGTVRATFDWTEVQSITPTVRAILTCAGQVAAAAAKLDKALEAARKG